MWAYFDKTNFPLVKVTFSESIDAEEDFNLFLKEWLQLYQDKKEFSFIFDTKNVGMVNISYCFKIKKFMTKLREFPKQYLQKSLIIVYSSYVKYLLNFIFKLTKPLATVYIYNNNDNTESLDIDKLFKNIEENKELELFTIIKP